MPTRAKQVIENGKVAKAGTSQRLTARQRGYTRRWDKVAKHWRTNVQKVCQVCLIDDVVSPAQVVDHIVPHRGDMRLFWDESNWQSLCKPCHDRKTGRGQ